MKYIIIFVTMISGAYGMIQDDSVESQSDKSCLSHAQLNSVTPEADWPSENVKKLKIDLEGKVLTKEEIEQIKWRLFTLIPWGED